METRGGGGGGELYHSGDKVALVSTRGGRPGTGGLLGIVYPDTEFPLLGKKVTTNKNED